MLTLLKDLLGINISDSSKDTVLNFYLAMSKSAIVAYKNKAYSDEEFEDQFYNQTVALAMYFHKNRDNVGMNSISQGGRSVSKQSELIPNEIKLSLGYPFISTIGTVI